VLRLEHVDVACGSPAHLFDGGEDVDLLELPLVIVLAKVRKSLAVRASASAGMPAGFARSLGTVSM
jgi:hypothetical protein